MSKRVAAAVLGSLVLLSGCSSLISATRDEPIQEDRGERTLGNYLEDEVIETKTLVNLSKGSQALSQAHVSVTSYNGLVLLTGQVPSDATRAEAEKIASQIREVRKVHNELQIAGPTSAIVRTNDAYLTSRVKLKLYAEKNLEGGRIKVVTENGTVFLMGLVSKNEADVAVKITRQITGVQKIVKVFEYI
ncbi:phospholipid-binding protein [Marinobacterium nitratireducens]|uniref:Phospholipid-binding protein n=1 Tax=Marinobacterium nitratireducens TaxID=518897 RepID=A0A917ZH24_9GAMM|nr:BON domain-containing protein [Marinobacterium nitratireducens]GGO82561.1 phospholipid-binding protein [Marinobacterium nitratireducens]